MQQAEKEKERRRHIGQDSITATKFGGIRANVYTVNEIGCVGGVRRTIRVTHLFAIAVIRGNQAFAAELEKFLEGCDLAGYNMTGFDLPVLRNEFHRAGIVFDVTNRAYSSKGRVVFKGTSLGDGVHRLKASVTGGFPGSRTTKSWRFTVDTAGPPITSTPVSPGAQSAHDPSPLRTALICWPGRTRPTDPGRSSPGLVQVLTQVASVSP